MTEPHVRHSATRTTPEAKRDRILAAAREVFVDAGFEKARMEDVAARAGVSKGTLYNFFESKENLLIEAVRSSMEGHRREVDRVVGQLAQPERSRNRLDAVLHGLYVDVFRKVSGESQLLADQVWGVVARDETSRERVFDFHRKFHRDRETELRLLLQEAIRDGEVRDDIDASDLALLLMSIFNGLLFRARFDRNRIDPERVLGALERLLAPEKDAP